MGTARSACGALMAVVAGCLVAALPEDGEAARRLVVYQDDWRTYSPPSTLQATTGDRTLAVMEKSTLTVSGGIATFAAESLGSRLGLCSGERFFDDASAAFCSATLVADDMIATAAHCLSSLSDCSDKVFVTGLTFQDNSSSDSVQVPASQVYECAEIVHAYDSAQLQHADYKTHHEVFTKGWDYAVIRLAQPATSDDANSARTPAPITLPVALPAIGSAVFTIGHPSGLKRIYTNGTVWQHSPERWSATLDTFGGNSGSGVFDETGAFVGVHVVGSNDYQTFASPDESNPVSANPLTCAANTECNEVSFCAATSPHTCSLCPYCCSYLDTGEDAYCPENCACLDGGVPVCKRVESCSSPKDIYAALPDSIDFELPMGGITDTSCLGEWQQTAAAIAPFVHVLGASCAADEDCTLESRGVCSGDGCSCGPDCSFHCGSMGTCQLTLPTATSTTVTTTTVTTTSVVATLSCDDCGDPGGSCGVAQCWPNPLSLWVTVETHAKFSDGGFTQWSECKAFCQTAATSAEAWDGGCCFWQSSNKECYLFLEAGYSRRPASIFYPDDYASSCTGGGGSGIISGAPAAAGGPRALLALALAAVAGAAAAPRCSA